jgi:hypothetical protein
MGKFMATRIFRFLAWWLLAILLWLVVVHSAFVFFNWQMIDGWGETGVGASGVLGLPDSLLLLKAILVISFLKTLSASVMGWVFFYLGKSEAISECLIAMIENKLPRFELYDIQSAEEYYEFAMTESGLDVDARIFAARAYEDLMAARRMGRLGHVIRANLVMKHALSRYRKIDV